MPCWRDDSGRAAFTTCICRGDDPAHPPCSRSAPGRWSARLPPRPRWSAGRGRWCAGACRPGRPTCRTATLLPLVPPDCQVRLEAVEDAAAIAFARAALTLLEAAGRRIEAPQVAIIRGIGGNGYLHFARGGRHGIPGLRNLESGLADTGWG